MANSLQERSVKDVMSRDVASIHFQDTVHQALALMVENRLSALPVVDGRGRCLGIISVTDVVALAREVDDDLNDLERLSEVSSQWLVGELTQRGMDHTKVEELMSRGVKSVGPSATVAEAARVMLSHHVHRLPVIDEQQRLLGIVSTMDILAAMIDGETV
ncbi:MAG: CBS domain-containing protein [Pirellulales bacterium]